MAPRKEIRARQQAKADAARRARPGGRAPVEDPPAADDRPPRRRRLFWMGVVAAAVAGVAFLGAFPARTYFRQQSATARAESELDALDTEIAELQGQIDGLQTDEEIEARAREDYHMTRPGEEVVTLLPAAPAPVAVPSGWPYSRLFAGSR
ncbi:MAG: septum formation initiator family protein [Acidimicrobiales bacterium]|nr:septum formation initiator family protein [Acidimicrobiales bacterium]MCB9373340.1 septum formation initiator family protein [Microthrixaceae bacterium]